MVRTYVQRGFASLLDRLTEADNSDVSSLALSAGEMPLDDPEAAILRDLHWLFNTISFESVVDLASWPNVQQSGLNFGVASVVGASGAGSDLRALEAAVAQAIARFEPRLRKDSLFITAAHSDSDSRRISIRIEGEYWRVGRWLPLLLQTWADRESGRLDPFNAH